MGLSVLFWDLLNISRIELGKMEAKRTKNQIENLLQGCFEEMKSKTEEKKLQFIFKKPKNPLPELNIDELKIRQVITNLIDNAIRYTQKGSITISVKQQNTPQQFYYYFCKRHRRRPNQRRTEAYI